MADVHQDLESRMAALPDGAWTLPRKDPEAEQMVILAAVLRAFGESTPIRKVRLAAILATSPALLFNHAITQPEMDHWRRLCGDLDDDPGDAAEQLNESVGWGSAVRLLRGAGAMVEDLDAQTWAPGDYLREFTTAGWPDGRAAVVVEVLRREGAP